MVVNDKKEKEPTMAYRHDEDLQFLSQCTDEELTDLVYCLTHDKDGETRWTEELTGNANYKAHYPNHSRYWQEIAAEIQCFGGQYYRHPFSRWQRGALS